MTGREMAHTGRPGLGIAGLLVLMLALGACATPKQMVHDPQAEFAAYTSFAWQEPPERRNIRDPLLDSELLDRRIEAQVAAILEEQGYRRVAADEADLLVSYHVVLQTRTIPGHTHVSYGYRSGFGHPWHHPFYAPYWGPYWGPIYHVHHTPPRTQRQAYLVVNIRDRAEDRLVWRGWRLTEARQDRFSDQRLERMLGRILDEFPPT